MTQIAEAFVRVRYDTDAASRASLNRTVKRDLGGVERQLASTNREMSRFSRGALVGTGALGGLGRAAAFASTAFIGGAGLVFALKSTVAAAEESQAVQAQLANALEAQNISLSANQEAIDRRTQALSQMSGLDDELITTTFINFVRRTGDVTKALNLNAIAVDVARGRNISLEASSALVTRASLGMAGSLRRVGIAARDGASATELLELLQRKYAGSAEAYGNTAAGAQERFAVALENTQEVIGAAVLPALTRALTKATDYLNKTETQTKIQNAANTAAEIGGKTVTALSVAYDIANHTVVPLTRYTYELDKAIYSAAATTTRWVNGSLPTQLRFLSETRDVLKDLGPLLHRVADGYRDIESSRTGASATLTGRANRSAAGLLDAKVKGGGFVGRPLTAAEEFAAALAGDPNNPNLLRQQREKYQRDLDYARQHADDATANTKAFADEIEKRTGQIRDINEHLANIAAANAEASRSAREKFIEALIPNAAGGRGSAAGSFEKFQAAIAGQLGAASGGGPASLDQLQGILGKVTTTAELELQIAEQRFTNAKKLLPYLENLRQAEAQAVTILKKTGATVEDQLRAQLALETTKARIRGIQKKDATDSGFTLAELFSEAGDEFARYGSNVGNTLSGQDARGQFAGIVKTHQTIVVQNFHAPTSASQALNDAHAGAINLRGG